MNTASSTSEMIPFSLNNPYYIHSGIKCKSHLQRYPQSEMSSPDKDQVNFLSKSSSYNKYEPTFVLKQDGLLYTPQIAVELEKRAGSPARLFLFLITDK